MGTNTRKAMMRVYYVSDREAFRIAKEATPRALDDMSAAAAGLAYAGRTRAEGVNCTETGTDLPAVKAAPVAAPITLHDDAWA